MEEKEEVWFTVQAIVSEIRDRNMKPSMHHMPISEACRSLRSCLRHHAKKENGRFVRRNSDTLIQYALRKVSNNTLFYKTLAVCRELCWSHYM
ncbi:hypothetical protein GBAR_LOCUS24074 [Geodia barretti]|uniref:Uncharacterized protein n=1 Tax=Geodia barretti TaxID=519541 RepID=A0AA35T9D9_GEOBA|nr:hypothetical protein GBAR_LOCUS24074 [Geodia barretti]